MKILTSLGETYFSAHMTAYYVLTLFCNKKMVNWHIKFLYIYESIGINAPD